MIVIQREREREAETQAEGEAGSMHREPDVGFDSGSPGSRPGPKAGAKPQRHPGIPSCSFLIVLSSMCHHKDEFSPVLVAQVRFKVRGKGMRLACSGSHAPCLTLRERYILIDSPT